MNARTIAVVAMLVLAAGPASSAQEPEAQGKTLHLMHIQTADVTRKAVQDAVDRFTEKTGAQVTVESIKNDPYKLKIGVALRSDSPPDVFHTWGGGVLAGFANEGAVAPLPDTFSLQGVSPRALAFCEVDGKTYAVPADVSIVGFWYRKSVFAQHGIKPPKTFFELLSACARLKQAGVTPIALGNVEHWPGAFYFDYLMLRLGAAKQYIEASNAAGNPADIPATRVAGGLIRALVEMDAFNEGFNGMKYDQSRGVLFKGEAAMTLMGSWLLSYAMSNREDVVPDLGLFAFPPLDPGPDSRSLIGGINAAYAVAAKSKHKDLAFELVRFLTDEAAARDWAATGRIPARKVEMKDAAPVLAEALALIEGASRIQLYFDQALEPAVGALHKPYTQSLFAAEASPLWARVLVGVGAILVLLLLVIVLKIAFRSGEGRGA